MTAIIKLPYIFFVSKKCKVKYARLTKLKDKASIEIYENMPKDMRLPKTWNAKKVKPNL